VHRRDAYDRLAVEDRPVDDLHDDDLHDAGPELEPEREPELVVTGTSFRGAGGGGHAGRTDP
jgi:hypothetical protein